VPRKFALYYTMTSTAEREQNAVTARNSQHDLLSKSATGASFLIILQVGSRALTFGVNQLLLRYLSPELLGISTQLEVYSISVLLFARESLRIAIQRQTDNEEVAKERKGVPAGQLDSQSGAGKTQTAVNLSYISIVLGVGFIFLLGRLYLQSHSANAVILSTPYFRQALVLYGVSAFLELLAEPFFVVAQQKSRFKVRAAAESLATLSRCVVTCGSTIWASCSGTTFGTLPFALGQLAYGIIILLVYYGGIGRMSYTGGFSWTIRPIFSRYVSICV
jgi:oligosaccharide translocation protein RFT1